MNTFPLLCLLLQLPSAFASLPAPVNLRVESRNLQNVLHWDPGPGTPPGTQFWIFKWIKKLYRFPEATNSTSFKLKLNSFKRYNLAVQASYNHSQSPLSKNITFQAVSETVIGPPLLSVAGCGTCIQVNISLPDLDPVTKAEGIHYDIIFRVRWRKGKDGEIQEWREEKRIFNLSNLEKDVEYCVQVVTEIRVNDNVLPSEWKCVFTSIPEPQKEMLILVVVTAVLIFLLVFLTMGLFCLYYTGFLCKLKEMPIALMGVLWPGYVLTLNSMDIDQVTIIPQTVKTRNSPTSPSSTGEANSEEEDGDEEEEEGAVNLYMDRNAEFSSGGGSYQNSADNSGNINRDAMKDSGGFMETQPEEVESKQYETKAEPVQVSFMHDEDQSGLQVQVTGQEEEIKLGTLEFSGDVNLFSVTLASMANCDEEEIEEDQDSGGSSIDFLRIYTLKPLSQIDSESEREDEKSAPLMHPSEENIPGSGHDGSCTVSWMEEEEEEEEEFSGYLTNK
ncbi:uncharacterized protein FYW61_009522 [Anableps anableps]